VKVSNDMSKLHRISAGAFIFKGNSVLLVRYRADGEGTFLVGPGGRLEDDENVVQAIIRETMEETGLTVDPIRVAVIEDLMCADYKLSKVWMICEIVAGELERTEGAVLENILEAGWFTKEQLLNEIVFPPTLMAHAWEEIRSESWQVEILPSRTARF
jgi:8-oxo-dGTP pyrophosphatase MutT (NUDIX family)